MRKAPRGIEWPTLGLLAVTYMVWALGTTVLATLWLPLAICVTALAAAMQASLWLPLAICVTALAAAMQASLCHEAIHGHPTRNAFINTALVFPALTLLIPYLRFRDTHLAHHRDAILTDPYDDPESNYLCPRVWRTLPRWTRVMLAANNTLLGRLVLGPMISQVVFMRDDWRLIRAGDRPVLNAWLWHIPAVAVVLIWLAYAAMPVWAYLLAAYLALSILKIRTFLEHQAHERARGRTVIIEDRGPLALIFLNNNLHVVHHMHPNVPWYRLPRLYWENRARYLARNDGYRYRSYAEVFRRYLLRSKDPVPHPLRPLDNP